jgi:hypothetical protein
MTTHVQMSEQAFQPHDTCMCLDTDGTALAGFSETLGLRTWRVARAQRYAVYEVGTARIPVCMYIGLLG